LASLGAGAQFSVGFVMADVYAAVMLTAVALLCIRVSKCRLPRSSASEFCWRSRRRFHTTHLVTAVAVSVAEAVIAYLLCGGKCGFSLQTVPAAAAAISFAVTLPFAFEVAAHVALA